jgi:hypothetical protein
MPSPGPHTMNVADISRAAARIVWEVSLAERFRWANQIFACTSIGQAPQPWRNKIIDVWEHSLG